jgi:hypothetical protein
MKRWMIVAGVLALLVVLGSLWYSLTGTTQVSKTIPMAGVAEVSMGDARLILVQDTNERLVVRTTRRQFPWIIVRQTGSYVGLGSGPDDSDPRVLLAMVGVPAPNDPVTFELHTSKVSTVSLSGPASLLAENTKADSLDVDVNSSLPSELRNVSLGKLHVSMQGGGSVKASGTVGSLSVTELAAGRFDGASLHARQAAVTAAASGIAVVDVVGKGITTFTASP